MRATVVALAVLATLSAAAPLAAQPIEFPTTCTDVTMGRSVFIGHDFGEWASIVVGTIVIREPWTGTLPASRAARIRARREGGAALPAEPTRTPKPKRTPRPSRTPTPAECHPDYVECLPVVEDLDCGDSPIGDGIVHLRDPNDDAYRLDVSRGVGNGGNGIGCDDES